MNTWLVLDANYLCYRALFTTGGLSYGGHATGVLFGFFRNLSYLQNAFATNKMVFCFDHGKGLREELGFGYKAKRRERQKSLPEDKLEALLDLRIQVKKLKTSYLKEMGFRNVLYEKGYEADDIIASVTRNLPKGDRSVIISADKDLWQLLHDNCLMYDPFKKQPITKDSFIEEWGIPPKEWAQVKAVAGCLTDNVCGLKGIGEKTAAKYFNAQLSTRSKQFTKISEFISARDQYAKNLKLVRLPYPGTPVFELRRDKVTREKWYNVVSRLGMKTLEREVPIYEG